MEVDDHGNLMTSGERPLDSTRRSRFHKVFRIPGDCNVDDIYAKFENGVLYVTHPKVKTTRLADHPQDRLPVAQTTETQREPKPKPADEPKHDMDKTAGATVMGETATKQAKGKSSELLRTAQKNEGKIVEKKTDRTAVLAGNGKVESDVKGDEATEKGIAPIDERKKEPKTEHEISEGAAAGSETETVRYHDGGTVLGPTKPMQPLLNVAVAILVLLCLAMYVAYKFGKAT